MNEGFFGFFHELNFLTFFMVSMCFVLFGEFDNVARLGKENLSFGGFGLGEGELSFFFFLVGCLEFEDIEKVI